MSKHVRRMVVFAIVGAFALGVALALTFVPPAGADVFSVIDGALSTLEAGGPAPQSNPRLSYTVDGVPFPTRWALAHCSVGTVKGPMKDGCWTESLKSAKQAARGVITTVRCPSFDLQGCLSNTAAQEQISRWYTAKWEGSWHRYLSDPAAIGHKCVAWERECYLAAIRQLEPHGRVAP